MNVPMGIDLEVEKMSKEIYELIKKYANMMMEQEYSVGENPRIYVKADGYCYATVEGADFGNLMETDIGQVALPNNIESKLILADNDINALVVSNTPYCDQCAKSGKEIYSVLDDMAQIVGYKVETVDYSQGQVTKALKKATGCLIKGQYTLSTGRNLYEAVVAMTVLEKAAEVCLKVDVLGGGKKIPKIEAVLMRQIYKKKYSKAEQTVKTAEQKGQVQQEIQVEEKSIDGVSPEEQEKRERLVEYGIKLVDCGLVQGTWGNLSMRLDDKYMLVTPSGLDYTRLTPADMVKVQIDSLEYDGDRKPTSEKGLHGGIFASRSGIGAAIHTHSKYCSIFAAAGQPMPIEDPEMQKIFGKSVDIAKYGLPGTKGLSKNTISALGTNFGCIMTNHGMICCGEDMETAFNNCVKLEECGKEYIEKRFERI